MKFFYTLVNFTLSLQDKHVGMDGPLLHILLHSLYKEVTQLLLRFHVLKSSIHMGDAHAHTHTHTHTHTHHFRVSSIDDDTCAVGRGGHLTGGAR